LYCYKCSAELKGYQQHGACWNCGAVLDREGGRAPTTIPRGSFTPRRAPAGPAPKMTAAGWIVRALLGLPWLLMAIIMFLLLTSASRSELTSFSVFGLFCLSIAALIFFGRRYWMYQIVVMLGIAGWLGFLWIFFGKPLSR